MSKTEMHYSSILDEILGTITPQEAEKARKRMLLAARIDDGIKAKGWKKIDLAKVLNKQPSEISKWLSGTHNFNSDTLFDIEEILNIGLVTLDNVPKEQVIKFYLEVNEVVITPSKMDYSIFISSFASIDQSKKQRTISSSKSIKSHYQNIPS